MVFLRWHLSLGLAGRRSLSKIAHFLLLILTTMRGPTRPSS